ncbi:MAG: hypothetical protein KDM81_15915, partial [Verrucomicrobiae bacterium]|nr:hypothetical protein [Verrucomicrobiae bacterium]
IPGLVVRQNGFTLGRAELAYGIDDVSSTNQLSGTNGQRQIRLGNILEFDDIRIGVTNFEVNFDAANPVQFNGSIYIASGGAKFFPGRPISATIKDRTSADDKNIDGTPNTEALKLQLSFTDGRVDSFQFEVDTLEVTIGTFVTLRAVGFSLDTGAADNKEIVSFISVGAQVKLGSLVIGGEARNFAFLGDGTFVAKRGFAIILSAEGASGESFKWPKFLPIKINAIGIEWQDIQNHPEDFTLILSASVTGIQGAPGLEFSGAIEGVRISPKLLLEGKFPITDIRSLGVTVSGKMFGGEINAGLIGGIMKLDAAGNEIDIFDSTTPVADRVFFIGLQGGFSLPGVGGLTIRLALSELGPLGVFLNVEVPGGIVLEPNTGLAINDFSAGVEFFKSLPSINDPFELRNPDFGLPTTLTAETWLAQVRGQVIAQYRAVKDFPVAGGFLAAFTAPMTITGSAKIYTIYTSQQVFNGQVLLKLSTDGKFLIAGLLNFAADNISLSGKLYADLSNVLSGDVGVYFLADIPDQVRLLTLHGKLKMGFKNAAGEDV